MRENGTVSEENEKGQIVWSRQGDLFYFRKFLHVQCHQIVAVYAIYFILQNFFIVKFH